MSHPAQQIRFCTSRDGVRIAYATCGAGTPLVWVQHWAHHLNFDWDGPVWGPWLSMLTRRHTLVRYDWRGCGLSDRERVDFSFEKYLDDLEAVVEAARIERFVLFGMSGSGSGTAMAYTVRHPDRVTRLVLQGCLIRGRFARNTTSEQMEEANTRLKVHELGWPSELGRPSEIPAYSQFFTSLHMPDATAEQTREHQHLLRQTTSPVNAIGMLRSFWELDVRGIVPQVHCPTLVLHARGDTVIPFDEGRSVAALIPSARFVPLESRNHILLDTEPAWRQLVEALDDFLQAAPSGLGGTPLDELTTREHEVLELVAQGLDNDAIGKQLHISKRTARNHVSAILAKLGATSRAQAIVRARDAGFGRKTSS
jgi:pimeloyl-ACP methyl ester carboxylesterase/DNA-binding CsgD family transcriptional regulator